MICYYCGQIARCQPARPPFNPGVMVCAHCQSREVERSGNGEAASANGLPGRRPPISLAATAVERAIPRPAAA